MRVSNSLLVVLLVVGHTSAQLPNFTNPILDTVATHPSVLKLGDWYYLTVAGNQFTEIHIHKSHFITNFRYVEQMVVYKTNVGYSELEAPKIHNINGELYMYFAMRNETVSQRLYVMKAVDPSNPMGRWGAPQRLLENIWSLTSVHGTVLSHNDLYYLVWASGHPVAESRGLYIAQMTAPTQVIEPIVSLRQPAENWECQGFCSNESPSFIYNIDGSYLVFSASSSSHPDHCLSYMSIESGMDPMNVSNWKSAAGPVFIKNEDESVFATGSASFTTSPDGTETWMVYHGSDSSTGISENLFARIEKIGWHFDTGAPDFPVPHGSRSPQQRPSGEPEMFTNPILDEVSMDPSMIQLGAFYYLVLEGGSRTELVVYKSRILTDFRNAERKTIYQAPEGFNNICCGKLYLLDGQLYIYFAMHSGTFARSPFVISAHNPNEPMGSWSDAKRILQNAWDESYDMGAVLRLNERLYFTWSGRSPDNSSWAIFIAQMQNPGEIVLPVVLLKQPVEQWECLSACHNGSPSFAYHNNKVYMIFAAHNVQYPSISYISIESMRNPLDLSNWEPAPGPIFRDNEAESVYMVDPNCFVMTTDAGETWLLHNARDNATSGHLNARMERIEWDADGFPVFPKPHGRNNPQPVPKTTTPLRI